MAVHRIVVVVDGNRDAPILFPGVLDRRIGVASWCELDAENGPGPATWPIQTGPERCARAPNGQQGHVEHS